ncbi:MAG TPA: hypothetical protein VMJ10_31275 [Kofleriaceae bacterium]|nr:hypothetical protein [Kofleriaceae bacterium]
MRAFFVWSLASCAGSLAFWALFGACVAVEPPAGVPQADVIFEWDPLACGDPHRIAVELSDDSGQRLATSVPCDVGAAELAAVAYGSYRGRIYAWALGEDARSVAPLELDVDDRVVRTTVATPK